nr:vegetative incompatibility protein het-e-1 [Quercus suber]
MRLLHVQTYNFKDHQKNPDPYAILPHRWTKSETTLVDIQSGRVDLSSASNKVSKFARYVKSQFSDLDWIWVDSCCINQDSAAELSEGVNCMFDWYRNASVCIAYLPDVEHATNLEAFHDSVWFTRGWTLQELLASTVVVFVTRHWRVIGHKGDAAAFRAKTEVGPNLEILLADVTRVPLAVLQDFSASHLLSVEERLGWLRGRETLKEEDMIYALFGIFGVRPGANYGEKRSNAEHRLLEAIDRKERLSAGYVYNAPDASTNHASASERRETDTCTWLLQHEQYKRWKAGAVQHLWVHGKPGCGKSVLCSTVIEDLKVFCLEHAKIALAYFYFTFSDNHKQTYDDLLLGLVAQLGGTEPARSTLRQLYERSKQTRPGTRELEKVLISTVSTLDGAFVVLDALDESPELSGTRWDLLKRLTKLLSQSSKLRLFATSRYLPDIPGLMDDLPCEHISIRSCDVSGDIQQYVAIQLSTEPRLRQFTPTIKSMIEKNVSDNADGMFRWAFLLLDQLAKLKKSNVSAIDAALTRFPKDLDDVYARILQDLEEDDHQDALTLLRWITYASEPLSLGELIETLIIIPEDDTVDIKDRCQPVDILRLLTSLVITISPEGTDGEDSTDMSITAATKVRLAHFTVQEYFESERILAGIARQFHLDSDTGHYFLTQSCLTYIMHYSSSDEKASARKDVMIFPLVHYAAKSWYHHASLHKRTDVDLQLKLLESDAAMSGWLVVHQPDLYFEETFHGFVHNYGTNLYYACYIGLTKVVRKLLEKTANVNAEGVFYGSALQAASAEGHIEVVKLLLEKNANIDVEGGFYGNALQAASAKGHVEIVKLLLEKNADVNAEGGEYGGALQVTSAEGHIEVVKLLLEMNADVNAEGGYYGSALQAASAEGHVEVVKLLLKMNANVNAEGGFYGSALQAASAEGHIKVVKLLLETNSNITVEGGKYGSALQAASVKDHIDVVKLLLEKNADVNAQGGEYGGALQAASARGHIEVVKLLLDMNANVNTEGGEYGSALQAASAEGHIEVAKLLLEKNADVNAEGGEYGSALQATLAEGYVEVVKLLLEMNANVNAQGGEYGSALQAASAEGHVEIVKLLLDMNANVNAEGGEYGSALQAASAEGYIEVVKLLLEKHADVNAQGGEYGSALQAASVRGHIEVVELLKTTGACTSIAN